MKVYCKTVKDHGTIVGFEAFVKEGEKKRRVAKVDPKPTKRVHKCGGTIHVLVDNRHYYWAACEKCGAEVV